MQLAEVVIREIERDRSLKVFQLFTECACEARKASAVHPQCVILFFDM